jgi:nitronate monooxygenase
MNLKSRVCDLLEIEKPIVLAGMGGASNPALAAAVSNAGGLGVLGAAACGPRQLRAWIRETRELTDKPFGVDTLLPASVRRANYDDLEGPTPADLLPDRQAFARAFMQQEGLAPLPTEAMQEQK